MIKRRLNYLRRRLSSRPVFHSQAILLFWALLMGVIGALATLLFFQGVKLLQWLMVGRSGSISDIVSQYSTWQTLLYPSLAGVVGGLLLTWSDRIKTDTNSDYMEAVCVFCPPWPRSPLAFPSVVRDRWFIWDPWFPQPLVVFSLWMPSNYA